VICVTVGCSSRSGHDKGVSFFRIPTVVTARGSAEKELTQKCRDGYLAAISREYLTDKILKNDWICSKHFVSGKPAYLYDATSVDWLPTISRGHSKSTSKRASTGEARYMRAKRRRASATEAAHSLLLAKSGERDQELNEKEQESEQEQELEQESRVVAVQATCSTSNTLVQTILKSEDMMKCDSRVLKLKNPQMFSEEYFSTKDNDFIVFYTGIPKFNVLHVVFDFVALPTI